jgi:hypothetical protein
MSPLEVGVEVDIIDEQQPVAAPTATDTGFLLHSTAEDTPDFAQLNNGADARAAYPDDDALVANADAFFGEGGARLYVSNIAAVTPDIPVSLARFIDDLGPGQLWAPEVVATAGHVSIANWAYDHNRIALLNGPDGATDTALTTLATAAIAAPGARNASMEADTLIIPGTASGTTREVPATATKAGLIARSDIATGNPNLAAAGIQQGRTRYALGTKVDRTDASRQALAAAQVNTFKSVYGTTLAAYGYLTLADLDALPHWWDLSGSRTVMAVRAREAAVAEQHMFATIDGGGGFLTRYEGALRGELAALARLGALYGSETSPAYQVDVSAVVNPIANLAQGQVTATITMRTSPHARVLRIHIIRRRLDQEA